MITIEKLVRSKHKISTTICYIICENCNYLDGHPSLITNTPCPNCIKPRKSNLIHMPYHYTFYTIDNIQYFLANAYKRKEDAINKLFDDLKNITDKEYSIDHLLELVRKIKEKARKDLSQTYKVPLEEQNKRLDKIFEIIQKALSCDEESAKTAFYKIILHYNDSCFEENIAVVTMALTQLELLFNNFIEFLAEARKREELLPKDRKKLKFEKNCEIFREITNKEFESEMKNINKDFYKRCKEINELRNETLHEAPLPISITHAEKACQTALDAFHVFATLHNRHCVIEPKEE